MEEQSLRDGKKVRLWCRQNKRFVAVVALQVLALLYLLVQLLAPNTSVTLLPGSFTPQTETNAVAVVDGVLQIENPQGDVTELVLTSDAFALTPGAYTMVVAYSSTYNTANPSYSIQEESVSLSLTASETQSLFVQADSLLLKDSATTAEGRVWVSLGEAVDTAQIVLRYNGMGQTNITSVALVEQNSWWLLQLCAALLLFVCVNVTYLRFFAHNAAPKPAQVVRAKVLVALLAITAIASLPLFANFLYDAGHDLAFHLARIASVAAELRYGQFPVRMQSEMVNGYGYVTSLFYCDIFLYLPAVLYNCMLPLQTAYQVYAVVVNFATACIAYYCFAKLSASRNIALVGAALYTLAIYRLVNLYLRAAVGEYTAMVFFPLVALGMWNIYKAQKPTYADWLPLALGMAGVLQCHVLSVEMLAIFLGLCCLLLFKQTFSLVRIKAFALAVALCAGVTAWYWVPFVHSFASMQLMALANVFTSIQSSGIYAIQLFALTGYASYGELTAHMPLTLGWALVLGAGLAGYALVKGHGAAKAVPQAQCNVADAITSTELGAQASATTNTNPDADNTPTAPTAQLSAALGIALLLGVVATSFTLQAFPWDAIGYGLHPIVAKLVNLVQFPWRYLAIATLCFALATVLALRWLRAWQRPCYQAAFCLLLALSVGTTGLFYAEFISQTETKSYQSADPLLLLSVGYGEYMLEGTDFSEGLSTLVHTSDDALSVAYQREAGVATVTYANASAEAQVVTLPLWNYPNYQAVDATTGVAYEITATATNCMQITLPAQQSGTLQITYVAPMLWRVAELLTLLSWVGVAFMAYKTRKGNATNAPAVPVEVVAIETEEKVLQTV